jgi:hypothetical protein
MSRRSSIPRPITGAPLFFFRLSFLFHSDFLRQSETLSPTRTHSSRVRGSTRVCFSSGDRGYRIARRRIVTTASAGSTRAGSVGVGPAENTPLSSGMLHAGDLLVLLDLAHLAEAVPGDDAHAEQAGDNAEGERHDALGLEAVGQRSRREVLAGQVQVVLCVGGCVADCGHRW